jgi:hypothetical protein
MKENKNISTPIISRPSVAYIIDNKKKTIAIKKAARKEYLRRVRLSIRSIRKQ